MSPRLILVGVALGSLLGWGCGGKGKDAKAGNSLLEQAFPGLAAVAPVSAEQAAEAIPVGDPKAYVSAALLAARTNDLASAITLARKALRLSGLTPAEAGAVQTARSAWVNELMLRADRGDAAAKAGVEQLNRNE